MALHHYVEIFRQRAERHPTRPAVIFSQTVAGARVTDTVTYAELDHQARDLAVRLTGRVLAGDRVVLAHPSGPEFLRAFLGCLYAGVIPVPTPIPGRYQHHVLRTAAILRDAEASLVLTDEENLTPLRERLIDAGLADTPVVATDQGNTGGAESWRPVMAEDDQVAFLQYTSGSTSEPKGVMVSQANLVHNIRAGRDLLRIGADAVFCSWLPTHHDMGLIAMTLTPLMSGGTVVLTPPMDFLRRPATWLELISEFGAEVSAAPNFGYELCLRRVSDEQLETLNLSRWRRACNGAEPIDHRTLVRFANRFAATGFRPDFLVAGYGMAETTLFTAGSVPDRPPVITSIEPRALERGVLTAVDRHAGSSALVGCGRTSDLQVRVVDPETARVLPDGRVGEIWLRGPSVALGYWRRPTTTEHTFRATTGDGETGFLRTGDLGVLRDGELYVTGRIKEMMIINGRNIYPQDVERELTAAFAGLTVLAGCAFSVPTPAERLVVIAETRTRGLSAARIAEAARRARAELNTVLGLGGVDLVLARPGRIRRTTSGKVRRAAMRELFMSDGLDAVHEELAEVTRRRYRPRSERVVA